ncbi:MAG: MATE family efflux transporter [Candidatus Sericytochromatia bacterium]
MFGIFLAFLLLSFIAPCEKIFFLMGLQPDVIDNAICFILPIFVGLPIFTSTTISSAIFRGIGDTKTPLKILSTSLILNAILAPLFIFGIFFPQMGISGGALATILCQTFAALVSIYLLKKRKIVNNSRFLDFNSFKEIFKIGSPIAVNGVIFCVVYLFLSRVIAPFGTSAIAALGIGHRIESISYCISLGFSIAATTLVGQNIGAKNNKRAIDIVWKTLLYLGSIIALISIMVLLFKEQIAMLFSSEPDVIKNAVLYLIAIGTTEVFLGFEVVMEGVFSGLGNTLPPTIIGLPINILRVPIAYYSSKYFGIAGIWWTIGLTTVLKGLILVLWFKKLSKSSVYLK